MCSWRRWELGVRPIGSCLPVFVARQSADPNIPRTPASRRISDGPHASVFTSFRAAGEPILGIVVRLHSSSRTFSYFMLHVCTGSPSTGWRRTQPCVYSSVRTFPRSFVFQFFTREQHYLRRNEIITYGTLQGGLDLDRRMCRISYFTRRVYHKTSPTVAIAVAPNTAYPDE